jgi:DNA-binding response OmpR family regulator
MATPRVLVVEDDPLVRRALVRDLTKVADVTAAASVGEVRTLLTTSPGAWDAYVLDGELGDGTAMDVIGLLKAPPPPVLVVTGTQDPRLLRSLSVAGAQVLRKPYDPRELHAFLERTLSAR